MSDEKDTPATGRAAPLAPFKFKPGESGNPAGRPKGARNRLSEDFLNDLLADWKDNGADAIAAVRTTRPADYLKVVASVVPKEFHLKADELDDLTDEQLDRRIAYLLAKLSQEGTGASAGASGEALSPEPASDVPTIQ